MGIWLTRARLSSYFQRLDAIRWTPYLDECIAVLAEKEEYPTDTLLIQFVKLQLIVEKVSHGPWHEEHDHDIGSSKTPPIFYLKALQAQLQELKATVPPRIQANGMNTYRVILPDAYTRFCRLLALASVQHRAQNTRGSPLKSTECCQFRLSSTRFSLCVSPSNQKLV